MTIDINQLLSIVIKKQGSDLHLVADHPPLVRVYGELDPLPQYPVLSADVCMRLVFAMLTAAQREEFEKTRELDLSYVLKTAEGLQERFRINAYYQRGSVAASLRYIPHKIRTFEELNLPQSLGELTKLNQGFILVTGPTGHGKSTTLATMINQINLNRKCHIVTIEDPIEYAYDKGKALISQRELRMDTYSWKGALKAVLREDPDVVLIGEMRDLETITSALTIAETGHLVFSTLHTNSAPQTIDRIIDVFPEHQQSQIRQQLSSALSAVICQRLAPSLTGDRLPGLEILISNSAVRTSIRESKSHLISNIIQTSKDLGMITMEEYFANLVSTGRMALDVAQRYVLNPTELRRYLRK
ncbi:MAG TPA: PilT/PilU family type 4a pilus ATPase [Patescibacteria group bacterium]|nr:PilT/PilU family type 4a pilus ATPase [Patescibacteria group bacterium]